MLYTLCIILVSIASFLLICAVLVQNPKSGMAANFGASNQVMGVRETANVLEKFTWAMAIAIVILTLVATLVMNEDFVAKSNLGISKDIEAVSNGEGQVAMPQNMNAIETEAAEAVTPSTENVVVENEVAPAATTPAPAAQPAPAAPATK